MTDNTIQHARDVLAKWREAATPGPWWVSEPLIEDLSAELAYDLGVVGGGDETLATVHGPSADARLIVGTAGNPDLLDAIDAILTAALVEVRGPYETTAGTYLAAAIIAADIRIGGKGV